MSNFTNLKKIKNSRKLRLISLPSLASLASACTQTNNTDSVKDIVVPAVKDKPVEIAQSKSVALDEDSRYSSFNIADFAYQDADAEDTFGGLILISSGAGVLYLADGIEVAVGETIAAADIADMYWIPTENVNDDTAIEFKVFSEGKESNPSAETFSYNINVTDVDDAPGRLSTDPETVIMEEKNLQQREEVSFSADDFLAFWSDPDTEDTFGGIYITNHNSESGKWFLDGVEITDTDFKVAKDDLDKLTFVADKYFLGQATIDFKVFSEGKENNLSLNNRIQFDVARNANFINDSSPVTIDFASAMTPFAENDQSNFVSVPGIGANDTSIDGETYRLAGFSSPDLTEFSSSIRYNKGELYLTIAFKTPADRSTQVLTDDIDGNGMDDVAIYVMDEVEGNIMPVVHILWDFDANFQSFFNETTGNRHTLDLSIGVDLAERGGVLSIMSGASSSSVWKDVYFKDMDNDSVKELFIINDENSGLIYAQKNLAQYNQGSPTEITMYADDYSAISSDVVGESLSRNLFTISDIDESGKADVLAFSKAFNPGGTSVGALHVIWDMLDTNEGFLYRDAADLNFTPHFTVYGIDEFDDLTTWDAQLYALEGDDKFNDLLFTVDEGGSGNNLLNNAGYIGLIWDIDQYSSSSYNFIDLANIGSNSALIISGGHESDRLGSSKISIMDFEGSQGTMQSMIVGAGYLDRGAIEDVGGYYFIWDINNDDYKVAGGHHIDLAAPNSDDRVLHILGDDQNLLLDDNGEMNEVIIADINSDGNLDAIIQQNSINNATLYSAIYILWDVAQYSDGYKAINLQDVANESVLKIFNSRENLDKDVYFKNLQQADIDLDGNLDIFVSTSINKSFIIWGGDLAEIQEVDLGGSSNFTKMKGNRVDMFDFMVDNYIFDDIATPSHPKDELREIISRTAEPAGSANEGMHGVHYGDLETFEPTAFSPDGYVDIV